MSALPGCFCLPRRSTILRRPSSSRDTEQPPLGPRRVQDGVELFGHVGQNYATIRGTKLSSHNRNNALLHRQATFSPSKALSKRCADRYQYKRFILSSRSGINILRWVLFAVSVWIYSVFRALRDMKQLTRLCVSINFRTCAFL